jgi:farnesyl-diphosphate farnesyltransferase
LSGEPRRDAARSAVASFDDLLLKTSRTFALSIPLLPEPTRGEVGLAYLLFRIADTLEDATCWTPRRQADELDRFAGLLEDPSSSTARELADAWVAEPPLEHDGYIELLSETPAVLEALCGMREGAREPITRNTVRTTRQMASFVQRKDGANHLQLRDVADLQAYCYAVAGIVGEMLTELFLLGREPLEPIAPLLRRHAATFGEGLQLVNILKDSDSDLEEGRSFLPRRVDRAEVFALARADLEAAGEYVSALQQARAPRGLVEFTALPVLLAWATLDRVEKRGAGTKISRLEVLRIVQRMKRALDRDRPAISR